MGIPAYVPGYPPDGSSLGQTKSTIRNNLDGTFQTIAVDHINNNGDPGSQPPGYHTIIHEVPQTSVSTVNGYNQIFSGVPGTLVVNGTTTMAIPANGDTQLYSLTGAGVLSQLTGGSISANGYTWLGGILLQWGSGTATTGGTSIAFPIEFPTALFSVTQTPYKPTAGPLTVVSLISQPSRTGFTAYSSGVSNPFYYMAIGN